ncbi:MAG: glycogen debranching protein, partial [Spirochaetota bacterium]
FDRPLKTRFKDTIIYEAHVKGFTYHQSSGVENKGTYKGITEKIPYLKELGVTAIELMPIQEFDENENLNINPATGEKLKNYWGYSTISFFAPRGRYASTGATGEQVYEFKEMVRDLHNAGIEIILDVVFNHTAEGDHSGPTLCFRGIDNTIYYMLEQDKRYYKNYSGCGNTFNCNNPIAREFIIDCLKFWVIEMHIDGFRFDLASILGRDEAGNILANPPLIERIEADPILRNTKIIAEAWDAAGAYQVGNFPGRWAEWNGKYRDDIRRFWKGDENMTGVFATRLTGSSDLYGNSRSPLHSINFITCHDGFPLNDLVCYNGKHNEANGEQNRDGENNNLSYNWGIEGPESTELLENLRKQMLRNFLATLFLSQGTPMLLSGDEFRRTQKGNNNAYCQ